MSNVKTVPAPAADTPADPWEAPPPAEDAAAKRIRDARTETSAILDAFRLLDGLSEKGRRRALDWLHSALLSIEDGEVPF